MTNDASMIIAKMIVPARPPAGEKLIQVSFVPGARRYDDAMQETSQYVRPLLAEKMPETLPIARLAMIAGGKPETREANAIVASQVQSHSSAGQKWCQCCWLTFFTISLPRTRAVKTPSAARAAQASMAARKLLTNVSCSMPTVAGRSVCCPVARIVPAAAPPRLAKIAPASATLRLCPITRPVARMPEAAPCWLAGAALIIALVLGAWKMP